MFFFFKYIKFVKITDFFTRKIEQTFSRTLAIDRDRKFDEKKRQKAII